MRRLLAVLRVILPGVVGLTLAALLEWGDRSTCPVTDGSGPQSLLACDFGPTYALLHPASPQFNHVFGALVFLAVAVLPVAWTSLLAVRLRRRWVNL